MQETHYGVDGDPNLQVSCVDVMGHPIPTVRYNVTGGISGPFTVDRVNGSVLIRDGQTVDYDEGFDFYNFTVECVDEANPTKMNSVLVNITILPVNEFFPDLEASTWTVNVSEALEVGRTILSTMPPSLNVFKAMDRDRGEDGRLRYLSNNTAPFFWLNSTSGALVLIQSLDIESNLKLIGYDLALLTVQMTVCDREEGSDDSDHCPNLLVQIYIHAVNEFYPKFSQKIFYKTFSESTEVGKPIVELNCTDQDLGRGRFQQIRINEDRTEMTTRNFSIFALVNNAIILTHSLDYETSPVHNITLICYDDDGKSDTSHLIITVTAINEYYPQFTLDPYEFTVNRIATVGKEIGQVIAIDKDQGVGGNVSYFLEREVTNFGIKSDGIIYLTDDIFTSESDYYSFLVTASDGEFNDTAQVNVIVSGLLNATETAVLVLGVVGLMIILSILIFICICCRAQLLKW